MSLCLEATAASRGCGDEERPESDEEEDDEEGASSSAASMSPLFPPPPVPLLLESRPSRRLLEGIWRTGSLLSCSEPRETGESAPSQEEKRFRSVRKTDRECFFFSPFGFFLTCPSFLAFYPSLSNRSRQENSAFPAPAKSSCRPSPACAPRHPSPLRRALPAARAA